MTEELLLKIYEFVETPSSQTEYYYKKHNALNNSDYLCKNSSNYCIESWYVVFDDNGEYVDDEYDTYFSNDITIESLKEFLIEIYGAEPLNKYRKLKLERICNE
jgi:hypothetical protein